MSKREELVECIGKLHEELVANVAAWDTTIAIADNVECDNLMEERVAIIRQLVDAIKELKLLEPAPCATTAEPAWLTKLKGLSREEAEIAAKTLAELARQKSQRLPGIWSGPIGEKIRDTLLTNIAAERAKHKHATEDCNLYNSAAFRDGYRAALGDYAYWKDGIQYVGSCGKTFAQALKEVDATAEKGGG